MRAVSLSIAKTAKAVVYENPLFEFPGDGMRRRRNHEESPSMSKAQTEQYDPDDPATWKTLSKVKKGEEISPHSYIELIRHELIQRPVTTNAALLKKIEQVFGNKFGPDDLRRIKSGKRSSRPKWMNNVDWAKAVLTKKGEIAVRSRIRKGKRETWIVLREFAEAVVLEAKLCRGQESAWTEVCGWVLCGKRRKGMRKKCPTCKAWTTLSAKNCDACGHIFKRPNQRVHKLPRNKRGVRNG
mgnify:FL=1